MTTLTKTQEAQTIGNYKATLVDEKKANADFRLTQVNPFYIKWNNGKGQIVTKRELNRLQKIHTYETDF